MAYVNVKDWSVDQVTEWLKGLDDKVLLYTKSFLNNGVTGYQLLQFRADDLENLGVKIIGHQEIILEGVEHLETLSPFVSDREYMEKQIQLLKLCIEMAFTAHRDKFSQTPVTTIRNNCEKLVHLADYIIQDVKDPLILQPASLDLTTLRKKEQELVKHGSPAHLCRKIEKGDEIVQVNYQTVVGWHREKVMMLLQDSSPEVLLTLKKRPQHTKVLWADLYETLSFAKQKAGTPYSRWNENLPSPRLLTINDLPQIPLPKPAVKTSLQELESESSSDNDTDTPDSPLNEPPATLFPLKSRPVLQRRNTITGASPTSTKPYQELSRYFFF
ncbi:connector enchancer of kinase suppressor of ras [Holotrichia oblita]|uniref:Connector enchancer of kinase suppressor of ras n=1 Tax=Holotrichia oblita TaxID=644536 RepID=A0ACB9TCV3_HOLOL|nr:connector enchancer of kinase suppressor of ras [Holotrichia oblita]